MDLPELAWIIRQPNGPGLGKSAETQLTVIAARGKARKSGLTPIRTLETQDQWGPSRHETTSTGSAERHPPGPNDDT